MDDSELIEICQSGNADKFQKFLDEMDLEDKGKYIGTLMYSPKSPVVKGRDYFGGEEYLGQVLAKTRPSIACSLFIPRIKSKIIVYNYLFNRIKDNQMNLGDAYSLIIDHEGTHAKDFYESPFEMHILMGEVNMLLGELRAFEAQEENFKLRGCSTSFIQNVRNAKKFVQSQCLRYYP